MDFEVVAREMVRALRGSRSQRMLSRRLGFSTNVLYAWEAGRTFPSASCFFKLVHLVGVDAHAALHAFYRVPPQWLRDTHELGCSEAVAKLLRDLAGDRTTAELAKAAGKSRFAIARLLSGEAEPRLPDFLNIVQCTTLRLLDFIAVLVDPTLLPSVALDWQRLDASRRLAYDEPMTHAVLRVLELAAYRALPAHVPGFIAERLGIGADDEAHYLNLLQESGQIELVGGRFEPTDIGTVDTRRDAMRAAELRRYWTRIALERVGQRDDDVFAFSLGIVSLRDLERVRELHRRYFTELRAIIGNSQPGEALVLANVQLVRLA